MQAQLLVLVGPISISGSGSPSHGRNRKARHWRHQRWTPPVVAASMQNHYAVLGLNLSATSADIKRAYRLLARKGLIVDPFLCILLQFLQYHPDVSKDSQASELFKGIRHAYEVLSNDATRVQYDQELKFRDDTGRQRRGQRNYSSEFDSGVRIYRWDELRQRMQRERYWEDNGVKDESSSFSEENEVSEGNSMHERGSFSEVLRSAFISLFLLHTFGASLSLTFSSLMALLDGKLDAGYKIGYVIAWILGGRGGILLTLSLSFASWACGKTSSSMVALVVVAMWVGSNLARCAPLPQGALLTLLYMSIKLQVDLK